VQLLEEEDVQLLQEVLFAHSGFRHRGFSEVTRRAQSLPIPAPRPQRFSAPLLAAEGEELLACRIAVLPGPELLP
jgi:hypothetical protein